jgi:hypothetical protein
MDSNIQGNDYKTKLEIIKQKKVEANRKYREKQKLKIKVEEQQNKKPKETPILKEPSEVEEQETIEYETDLTPTTPLLKNLNDVFFLNSTMKNILKTMGTQIMNISINMTIPILMKLILSHYMKKSRQRLMTESTNIPAQQEIIFS